MSTPRFPIEHVLTPEPPAAAPDGFTLVDDALLRGLPHRMALEGELALVLVVPSGEAMRWRDAAPDLVLSRSNPQRAPTEEAPEPREAALDRVPARLLLTQRRRAVAVLPLAAGLSALADVSGDGRGPLLEIMVLDWDLRTGNLRGPGDYGGRIRLAWRHRERAAGHFATPPVNPYLLPRLEPEYRMTSVLGSTRPVVLHRFTAKQQAFKLKLRVRR